MSDTATATVTKTTIKLPSQWKVVMLNDDFTPMDFVVSVLVNVFDKNQDEARQLTESIHNTGRAVVLVTTLEVARQKVDDTMKLAANYSFDKFKVIKEQA
ncbi:ATP-dependent Clp protease adapter protein ClpS [compost metagenome]